jgi:hypothetical protein
MRANLSRRVSISSSQDVCIHRHFAEVAVEPAHFWRQMGSSGRSHGEQAEPGRFKTGDVAGSWSQRFDRGLIHFFCVTRVDGFVDYGLISVTGQRRCNGRPGNLHAQSRPAVVDFSVSEHSTVQTLASAKWEFC